MFLLCGRSPVFFDVFRRNSSSIRQTLISLAGFLLRTTKRIPQTHSNFVGSSSMGWKSVSLLFVCHHFVALAHRPNGLMYKNVVNAEELMATGSSARDMIVQSWVTW